MSSKRVSSSNKRQSVSRFNLRSLWENHIRSGKESLNRLLEKRLASLMTIAVIGISLLLPSGLFVTMKNLSALGEGFNELSPITLYLELEATDKEALEISEQLLQLPEIAATEYISAQQGASDFASFSGLGDVLSALDKNPLPATIVVTPQSIASQEIEGLISRLAQMPKVETAQADLDWLARLQELLALAGRAANALMIVFSAAVLFVVGNTIKLSIEGRRAEIVVVKLVGGTDAYVARPFLYTGLWLGLAGGLLAWALLHIILLALNGPIDRLLQLYDSQFDVRSLGIVASISLLGCAAALGWLGAWVSVKQHLADVEPH
ncbi:MAG: permease-like cell division protein FtsX [Pseudohongiellaceae bacterium]|nr:permease-like cell division protein FtsX [Pseudohongiellaceae bacterium]